MMPPVPARRERKPIRYRVAMAALIGLVALVGSHALVWRFMAQQVEAGFVTWVDVRRAQGWRIDHDPPSRGGWPFAVRVNVTQVSIEGGGLTVPGGLLVAAERMVLSTTLPWIDTLLVDLPGIQRVRLGGHEWRISSEKLNIVVPLATDTLPREAQLAGNRLRVTTSEGDVAVSGLRARLATSSTATEAEAAVQVAMEVEGMVLPVAAISRSGVAFGREISTLSFDAALTGPVPPSGALSGRAEAWRDGGGTLELRSASLQWGPVSGVAAATLALDENLQPMGAGTLRLVGAAEALDALAEAGMIGRRAAATARAMLPLLSRPVAGGAAAEVDVPLTIEARTLAVARIPVVRMLPLQWSVLPATELSD